MWVFLATEVMFFGVLFAAYVMTRLHHPQGFILGSRHTDIVLGTINTAVLLTSSLTVALADRAVALNQRKLATGLIIATIALGFVFLALKGTEYVQDWHQHLVPALNFSFAGPDARGVELFFYLYFVTTLLHALHLTIGIGLMAVMAVLNSRGKFSSHYFTPVKLSGLYWHFVDIVWIFLYPLLYLVSRS